MRYINKKRTGYQFSFGSQQGANNWAAYLTAIMVFVGILLTISLLIHYSTLVWFDKWEVPLTQMLKAHRYMEDFKQIMKQIIIFVILWTNIGDFKHFSLWMNCLNRKWKIAFLFVQSAFMAFKSKSFFRAPWHIIIERFLWQIVRDIWESIPFHN